MSYSIDLEKEATMDELEHEAQRQGPPEALILTIWASTRAGVILGLQDVLKEIARGTPNMWAQLPGPDGYVEVDWDLRLPILPPGTGVPSGE